MRGCVHLKRNTGEAGVVSTCFHEGPSQNEVKLADRARQGLELERTLESWGPSQRFWKEPGSPIKQMQKCSSFMSDYFMVMKSMYTHVLARVPGDEGFGTDLLPKLEVSQGTQFEKKQPPFWFL